MMFTKILRTMLMATSLALAACATPVSAGFDSPQALLDDIYGQYADQPAGSGIDLGAPGMVDKYFAPELAQKIKADSDRAKANNDIPALNGDPFIDSQDWKITDLAIAVGKSAEPDKTMAIVTFKNYAEQKEIKLALEKTALGWQIADIDWGYEKLSSVVGE